MNWSLSKIRSLHYLHTYIMHRMFYFERSCIPFCTTMKLFFVPISFVLAGLSSSWIQFPSTTNLNSYSPGGKSILRAHFSFPFPLCSSSFSDKVRGSVLSNNFSWNCKEKHFIIKNCDLQFHHNFWKRFGFIDTFIFFIITSKSPWICDSWSKPIIAFSRIYFYSNLKILSIFRWYSCY